MPNRSYSDDFKLRVVAIASVKGVPEAARQFGVEQETVRAWQAAMPYDSRLQLAYDLALSEVIVDIAEGKNRQQLATRVGIFKDKIARYARPAVPDTEPQEQEAPGDAARHRLIAWIESLPPEQSRLASRLLHQTVRDALDQQAEDAREFDNKRAAAAAAGESRPAAPEEPVRTPEEEEAGLVRAWAQVREWIEEMLPTAEAFFAEVEAREAARNAQRRHAGDGAVWLSNAECDLLIEAEAYLAQLEETA